MTQLYPLAYFVQIGYAILVIVWNGVVMLQRELGIEPIGPTGSMVVIMGAVMIGMALSLCRQYDHTISYLLLSVLVGVIAAMAISASITRGLGVDDVFGWQLMGILINALGVLSALMAALGWFAKRSH